MRKKHQINESDDFLTQLENEDNPLPPKKETPKPAVDNNRGKKQSRKKLSPGQKFFLSFLFFLLVLIFGFFIMLITGTMVLP